MLDSFCKQKNCAAVCEDIREHIAWMFSMFGMMAHIHTHSTETIYVEDVKYVHLCFPCAKAKARMKVGHEKVKDDFQHSFSSTTLLDVDEQMEHISVILPLMKLS